MRIFLIFFCAISCSYLIIIIILLCIIWGLSWQNYLIFFYNPWNLISCNFQKKTFFSCLCQHLLLAHFNENFLIFIEFFMFEKNSPWIT